MSTWLEDVQTALKNLGGEAHLSKIFEEVKRVKKILILPGQEPCRKS